MITLVNDGETTITASFAGDETYNADEANYVLTVNPAPVTAYSITLSQEGEYCHGSWSGNVEAGTDCSLTPESGYSFDQTATGTILLASSEQAQLSFDSEKGTVDFVMPAEAVTITVTVYQIRNAISYEGTAAEHVIGQANGAGGEEITIIPDEGYTFDESMMGAATVLGIRAFDASDENVELEVTIDTANDTASFTMPAYAVRVTVDVNAGDDSSEPSFETLNITQAQDYELNASVQTDTDWTGKTLYASLNDNDSIVIYLKMVPDGTDPTLLVLDTDYDGNVADETYLDSNATGSVTVTDSSDDSTYTCDYSWTNEVVVP